MIKLTEDQYNRLLEYAKYSLKSPCNGNKCIIKCSGNWCLNKQKFDSSRRNKFQNTEDIIHADKDVYALELNMEDLLWKEAKIKKLEKEIKELNKEINSTKRRMLKG
jgi:hypothetical protein